MCVCVRLCNWQAHRADCLQVARATAMCLVGRTDSSIWLKARNAKCTRNTDKRLTELTLLPLRYLLLLLLLLQLVEACQTLRQTQKLFWPGRKKQSEREREKCKLRCCRCQMAAKGSQKKTEKYRKIYLFQLCIIKSVFMLYIVYTESTVPNRPLNLGSTNFGQQFVTQGHARYSPYIVYTICRCHISDTLTGLRHLTCITEGLRTGSDKRLLELTLYGKVDGGFS